METNHLALTCAGLPFCGDEDDDYIINNILEMQFLEEIAV